MKTKMNLSVGAKARQVAFTLACLLLLTGGWGAKTAVDRIGDTQDELASDMSHPSDVYLLHVNGRDGAKDRFLQTAAGPDMPSPLPSED